MVAFQYTAVLISALFALLCGAQQVQDAWISPASPDYSGSIQIGKTFQIRWSSDLTEFFGAYAPSIDVTDVTLWLTVSDDALNGAIKIKEGINIQTTNTVDWEVALTASQLQLTTKWVFRFLKADASWSVGTEEISSPPVIVKAAPVVEDKITKTNTTPTATATNKDDEEDEDGDTAGANPTDETSDNAGGEEVAEGSDENNGNTGSAGLSGGAKGGIAGGVVGGLAVIGGAFLLWRRKKKQDEESATLAGEGFPAAAARGAGADGHGAHPTAYASDLKTTAYEVSGAPSPMKPSVPQTHQSVVSELPGASNFPASELEAPHSPPPPR